MALGDIQIEIALKKKELLHLQIPLQKVQIPFLSSK